MTFQNLKRQVGKNLKYYTNTDGWLTDRDVTETDIGDFINDVYREDLFPMFATQYPEDFVQIATTNSWIATGTVSASSTGTTLVATGSIFTNSMVGLRVYNSTDDDYAYIESYTSATTVTLDTTIGDTWDGDTIWILGQEFTFGGDANDIFVVNNVGIKYNDTDTYYTKAVRRDKPDFYQYGGEVGIEGAPDFYLTTVSISGILTSAIGLIPQFSKKISNALQIEYIGKPATLSADGDLPRLNFDNVLIYGATARSFEAKREFQEATYWANKYENHKKMAISRYRPRSTRQETRLRVSRSVGAMYNRNI